MTKEEVEIIEKMINLQIEASLSGAFSYDWEDSVRYNELKEELTK